MITNKIQVIKVIKKNNNLIMPVGMFEKLNKERQLRLKQIEREFKCNLPKEK